MLNDMFTLHSFSMGVGLDFLPLGSFCSDTPFWAFGKRSSGFPVPPSTTIDVPKILDRS